MKRMLTLAALFAGTVALAGRVPGQAAGLVTTLPEKSEWKGTLTQDGKYKGKAAKLDFTFVLKITARNGDTFEADLIEESGEMKVTYLVKGTVTQQEGDATGKVHDIKFTSIDTPKLVRKTEAIINVKYDGTLKDTKLEKGTWELITSDADNNVKGTFEFSKQ